MDINNQTDYRRYIVQLELHTQMRALIHLNEKRRQADYIEREFALRTNPDLQPGINDAFTMYQEKDAEIQQIYYARIQGVLHASTECVNQMYRDVRRWSREVDVVLREYNVQVEAQIARARQIRDA